MSYKQLTSDERVTFSTLRHQGLTMVAIALAMGRHRSTLYRELKRNRCYKIDHAYRHSKADRRARARRSRSRRNQQYSSMDFLVVRKLLKLKWSPEQIMGHLRRVRKANRQISHETIYRYIWKDKAKGGSLWKHLRQSPKLRRKRYKAYDSRGRLADKRHITDRPASVEGRRIKGHWEIDTVHGKGSNHCIVTLVERKTGFVLIGKLLNKSTQEMNQKVIQLIKQSDMPFKTITADNGTEFHQYKAIEKACGVTFYFATPYHSWERGSSENVNGLIRQYLPKKESMANVSQQKCSAIARSLNDRPRKRHDFKTPREKMYG